MSAAALVALARRYAPSIREAVTARPEDYCESDVATVYDDGFVIDDHAHTGPRTVFSAPLTAENVASDDALVRALLASAITVETRDGFFIAYVGDHFTDTHFSEAEARDALLDALLGEVTAP